ncbi:hypothetical protein, partial [Morganella morganii]|uniref:hypothetical protein n=1 Tax=Morganella morganii TaxID=582 RepID=UPI0019585724
YNTDLLNINAVMLLMQTGNLFFKLLCLFMILIVNILNDKIIFCMENKKHQFKICVSHHS